MSKSNTRVIIIGAGIAGLATAIRLALQEMTVSVYEKNDYPGGKLHAFEQDGFHFDAGPSLFTQPQLIEELFAAAGEPMADYLQYRKEEATCNYFYEDGTRLTTYADREKLKAAVANLNSHDAAAVDKYLDAAARAYSNIGNVFLDHSLHKRKSLRWVDIFKALGATRKGHLFKTLNAENRSWFRDARLVQLFNRYATFNGSDPYKAPGMLSMIPHLDQNEGVFYPQGGMVSITDALYKLAVKLGVHFHFESPVQRIIVHENRAIGVVVHDKNILADLVVSNMDVYFTYAQLLNDSRKAKKLLKQERSSSALIFYWSMGKSFPELDLHNIFFAADYKAEFDHLFRLKKNYSDPTVYVNITSKCEPGVHAPEGMENWFVMVNAPANIGQDWEQYRNEYRSSIIAKLNKLLNTDLESVIKSETILDPVGIEKASASFMGSLYGTSSNSKMAAFLRHPNFSRQISGLYFVGGSVHPGGGIPLCLRSARITAAIISRDKRKEKAHS